MHSELPQTVAELEFCVMLIRLIPDTWCEQADKPSKISCAINVMVMQKAAALHELGGNATSLLIFFNNFGTTEIEC